MNKNTCFLESTKGGTSQGMKRQQASKGHLPTKDHRRRDKLGYRESKQAKGTHRLVSAESEIN
jgi:hypothetical protein